VQSGQKLRVRGRGLEMSNGRRGDLIVVVDIWIPQVLDEDAKRLIREFGERVPAPARGPGERATVQR
jgi:molecular chaperone DnaJ